MYVCFFYSLLLCCVLFLHLFSGCSFLCPFVPHLSFSYYLYFFFLLSCHHGCQVCPTSSFVACCVFSFLFFAFIFIFLFLPPWLCACNDLSATGFLDLEGTESLSKGLKSVLDWCLSVFYRCYKCCLENSVQEGETGESKSPPLTSFWTLGVTFRQWNQNYCLRNTLTKNLRLGIKPEPEPACYIF